MQECFVKHGEKKLQAWFAYGRDYCVGDEVRWLPNFWHPGEGIDGVHEAATQTEDGSDGEPFWVTIKDGCIVAVVDRSTKPEQADELRAAYNIQLPSRDLWPETAWEAAAWKKELTEKLWEARKAKLVEQYMANWRLKQSQPKRSPSLHPASEHHRHDEVFFAQLNLEPCTEEEARKQAEAICAVNEFTRAKLREPGFYRMITGPWDTQEELIAAAQEVLDRHWWEDWGHTVPEQMLPEAICYVVERALREQGLWDTTKYLRIVVDISVLQNPRVHIGALHDFTRPAED